MTQTEMFPGVLNEECDYDAWMEALDSEVEELGLPPPGKTLENSGGLVIREVTSAFWGLMNSKTGKIVAPVRGSVGPALVFQKREEARALRAVFKKKYPRRHYCVVKFFAEDRYIGVR